MRPHSFVLAVVFAYLTHVDPKQSKFRVSVKCNEGLSWKYQRKIYRCEVQPPSQNDLKIKILFEGGGILLPTSAKTECEGRFLGNAIMNAHVVTLQHPYHYVSINEVINYHFNVDKYGFTGQFESQHDFYKQYFNTVGDTANYKYPNGLKVEGQIQSGQRMELEIDDFQVG